MSKNDTIKVMQYASPISRNSKQRKILIGLGLNKLNRVRVLKNTPETLGMVNKIKHLVKILDN